MKVLSGLNFEEIRELTSAIDSSQFRAKQVYNWVYLKCAKSIDDMTDLSKKFREELKKIAVITDTEIVKKQTSEDGTIKYLLKFPDGEGVETVLMRFDNRANLTACVSSQVGCAMGCKFCATGKNGFERNLSAKEIIEQVLTIQRDTGLKVTNVVFMGQGEPLLNLENVLSAVKNFNDCFQIGARRITISTSGIIPKINELSNFKLQLTLAISLHAPSDEIREQIMPVAKKYPLSELKTALKNYCEKTGRRITTEYILIGGVNDSVECAKKTAQFLKDIKTNINLIPYNPIDSEFKKSGKQSIMKFKYILEHSGKKVTIRLERGADIDAACGQLKGKLHA